MNRIASVAACLLPALVLVCARSIAGSEQDVCTYLAFEHQGIPAGHRLLWDLAAGDLDGDGDADLAALGIYPGYGVLSVRMNRGDGTFEEPTLYAPGGEATLVIEDMDDDSDLDLILTGDGKVLTYANRGDGVFVGPTAYEFPDGMRPIFQAVADLDNDDDLDISASNAYGTLEILWNRGNGTFDFGLSYAINNSTLYEVVAEDLNGDTFRDLAVLTIPYEITIEEWGKTHWPLHDEARVVVFLNNGNGEFHDRHEFPTSPWPTLVLTAVDIDTDGDFDLAGVSNDNAQPDPNGMWLLFNDGKGLFSAPIVYSAGADPHDLDFGDVDGDGDLDAVVPDEMYRIPLPHHVSILRNRGDGTFMDPQKEVAGVGPFAVAFAHLDGDESLDIAVANIAGWGGYVSTISVLLNLCDTQLNGDLDDDGDADLLDVAAFQDCFTGQDGKPVPALCGASDFDTDGDVDLLDWIVFRDPLTSP